AALSTRLPEAAYPDRALRTHECEVVLIPMVSELVADQETARAPASPRRDNGQVRAAAIAFAVIEFAGFIFYIVAGRHLWFCRDEWDFLAAKGFNGHDLIEPHGGHLSVVPL